ncbi:MAG: hypothetical protein U9Q77_09530 [Candidatus Marinimicrobia bacterium]|nr:hypothetical protein [Candidatus Neomarinimicrobiota bacterium]
MTNLDRVQGFLHTLNSEIDDPGKMGPGTSREEWKQLTEALQAKLLELDGLLRSKDWKSADE